MRKVNTMQIRRDWFHTVATIVFEAIVLISIVAGLQRLGEGKAYPYLLQGGWLVAAALTVGFMILFGILYSRLQIRERLSRHAKPCMVLECLTAGLLITAAAIIRLRYIQTVPMGLYGDYKTYYEVGELLYNGTLIKYGTGYCDYIAMFPHVIGYPQLLASIFRLFQPSIMAALYLNLVLQVLTLVLVWRITRTLAGRLAGMVALAAFCFWPSTIIYSNFVASEFEFTFLLFLGMWLMLKQMTYDRTLEKRTYTELWLLVGAGLVFGIASICRPMVLIYIVAVLIFLRSGTAWLPARPKNSISLGLRATHKGWQRALILLLVYFITSFIGQTSTRYEVGQPLAGTGASFGFYLMEGTNVTSNGSWNKEDSDFLYAMLDQTGSPTEAQLACRDRAIERIKNAPLGIMNLLLDKVRFLMGNDEYAASLSTEYFAEMGVLDEETQIRYYNLMTISDFYYLLFVFLAGAAGLFCYFKKIDFSYSLILLVDGTTALHMMLENQNRYHYFLLPIFAILASIAFAECIRLTEKRVLFQKKEKEMIKREKEEREKKIALMEREEHELQVKRAAALHAQFDMGKAIEEGHIRIVASQATNVHGIPVQPQSASAPQAGESAEHAPEATEPEATVKAEKPRSDEIEKKSTKKKGSTPNGKRNKHKQL